MVHVLADGEFLEEVVPTVFVPSPFPLRTLAHDDVMDGQWLQSSQGMFRAQEEQGGRTDENSQVTKGKCNLRIFDVSGQTSFRSSWTYVPSLAPSLPPLRFHSLRSRAEMMTRTKTDDGERTVDTPQEPTRSSSSSTVLI